MKLFIESTGRLILVFLLLNLSQDVWGSRLYHNWLWLIIMLIIILWASYGFLIFLFRSKK